MFVDEFRRRMLFKSPNFEAELCPTVIVQLTTYIGNKCIKHHNTYSRWLVGFREGVDELIFAFLVGTIPISKYSQNAQAPHCSALILKMV